MHVGFRRGLFGLVALALVFVASAISQQETSSQVASSVAAVVPDGGSDPKNGEESEYDGALATLLERASPELRTYDEHIVTLSSPFCEGRVPGSRGMEFASQYVEFYFKRAGLIPAFDEKSKGEDGSEVVTNRASWRQPFPLSGTTKFTEKELTAGGVSLIPEEDFGVSASGSSGSVDGPIVFVGYSIEQGPEGHEDYATYDPSDDLTGKIALVYRFEPMNNEGKSQWAESRWSMLGLDAKIRAAVSRGASAVLIATPPGADDPRTTQKPRSGGSSRQPVDCPVLQLGVDGVEKLLASIDCGRTALELRKLADQSGGVMDLGGRVSIRVKLETVPLVAENVGGVLPGKGSLKDEWVVMGAHLDHLGMGEFGSRSGPGALHPGADDNASGTAAIIMLAERLHADYAALPPDAAARSILFLAFSAEESGLNGSRYYADNPIAPIENHKLMINFDMIGRIKNKRLSVSGVQTGKGMKEWLEPIFAASPLSIVVPERFSGASDHSSFYRKDMPVLFAIIADFHEDYHTPKDVSWKINREDAVHTIDLFHNILREAGTRPEMFAFERLPETQRGEPSARSQIKVRFGITPASYDDDVEGVLVGDVTSGSCAADGGIKKGDRLVSWDGELIKNMKSWMEMLSKHGPGDLVKVGVERDGAKIAVLVTLKGRDA